MFELLLTPHADCNADKKLVRTEGLRPDKHTSHRRQRRQAANTIRNWLHVGFGSTVTIG